MTGSRSSRASDVERLGAARSLTAWPFKITARDGAARAGVIHTAHGDVRTPAFVPLASTATVKSLHAAEVAALGYDMVLGNTFHLFIQPGPRADRARWAACTSSWAGAGRSSPTPAATRCSRWATGRSPRRSSAGASAATSMIVSIDEEGVRFRSYLDGARALHGARDLDGGPGGARLGHRARLRRVHAVPRRARLHGALDGAHPPLARPLRGLARASTRPPASCSTASCRAASTRTCARESTAYVAGVGRARHRDRRLARPGEGADARGGRLVAARPARRRRRATCWASATSTTSCTRSAPASTPSTARRPRGSRATAPRSCPTRRAAGGSTSRRAVHRTSREPIDEGCPCPACREHTRGYLHYLVRAPAS